MKSTLCALYSISGSTALEHEILTEIYFPKGCDSTERYKIIIPAFGVTLPKKQISKGSEL